MDILVERQITCPYCSQVFTSVLDCSVPHQNYIEDCQICCRPIVFDVTVCEDGKVNLQTFSEND